MLGRVSDGLLDGLKDCSATPTADGVNSWLNFTDHLTPDERRELGAQPLLRCPRARESQRHSAASQRNRQALSSRRRRPRPVPVRVGVGELAGARPPPLRRKQTCGSFPAAAALAHGSGRFPDRPPHYSGWNAPTGAHGRVARATAASSPRPSLSCAKERERQKN